MDFHLEFFPKPIAQKISHQDKLLLIGSCFTENIGTKLKQHKFSVLENPNGILFNPVSICNSLSSYIDNKQYREKDLFYQNECWNSWQHHSKFSHPDKNIALETINQSRQLAHEFLKNASWLMITLGSAFVYELEDKQTVANCHKVPADKFSKRLLATEEIVKIFNTCIRELLAVNPSLKIIFTISPVRHLRDGFVENNRSKSALIQAVHQLVGQFNNLFYFPAYELIIDDLRDYRFYAEDMVHPNYAATNYVWDKFVAACIGEATQLIMQDINVVNAAMHHKPFNPSSAQHKKFLKVHLEKVSALQSKLGYVNFNEELKYFSL